MLLVPQELQLKVERTFVTLNFRKGYGDWKKLTCPRSPSWEEAGQDTGPCLCPHESHTMHGTQSHRSHLGKAPWAVGCRLRHVGTGAYGDYTRSRASQGGTQPPKQGAGPQLCGNTGRRA